MLRAGLVLSSLCALVAAQTVLDDASPSLTYSGAWTHDTNSQPSSGQTESWTNDPAATVSFSAEMTGFDYCASTKMDRGAFAWSIDGQQAGTGTQIGTNTARQACSNVASVRNLTAGQHRVVISNAGSSYIAVDSIKIYTAGESGAAAAATVTTKAAASSVRSSTAFITSRRGASTTVITSVVDASTSSSSKASASATAVPATSGSSKSNTTKVAAIGGSIAGGLVLAAVLAALYYFRKGNAFNSRESFIVPPSFKSSHYLDDSKSIDWHGADTEKELMRQYSAQSNRPDGLLSHLVHSTKPFGNFTGHGHGRQPSDLSYLSNPAQQAREQAQLETPLSPVAIQPYFPEQYAASETSSIRQPDTQAVLAPTNYNDRIAAASANLPDFRSHASSGGLHRRKPSDEADDCESYYAPTDVHRSSISQAILSRQNTSGTASLYPNTDAPSDRLSVPGSMATTNRRVSDQSNYSGMLEAMTSLHEVSEESFPARRDDRMSGSTVSQW